MKKLKSVLSFAFLLTFVGAVSAQTGQLPDPMMVKRGLTVYTKNCLSCHQAEGVGERIPPGIRAPNYLPSMPLNEISHAWHHGDEQLIEMIKRGNKRMPPFKQVLSEAELRDVLAYVKSLWSDRIVACQGAKHMSCM